MMAVELPSQRIEDFLDAHPDGPLTVLTFTPSVAGLAWLASRTEGRPVTVLIGDAQPARFAKASKEDREIVGAFLARSDVKILNWYRTAKNSSGPASLHAKAFMVSDQAVLLGSANLTNQGLHQNLELMSRPHPDDLPRVVSQIKSYVDDAWDAKSRIREAIGLQTRNENQPLLERWRSASRKDQLLIIAAPLLVILVLLVSAVR